MKPLILAIFATAFSFIFLSRFIVRACGGRVMMWKLLVFHLFVGIGVYFISK